MNIYNLFLYTAIISTVLFILKLIIFAITGSDTEVFGDFDTIEDTDSSFNFISIQSILAFLMGFGWMGYGCLTEFKLSNILSFVLAFVVGILFMFFSSYLMFLLKKLEHKVTIDLNECVSKEGTSYTKFEPKGKGQIQIDINGKLSVIDAVNNSNIAINSFEQVKVIKFENDTLYIEKK